MSNRRQMKIYLASSWKNTEMVLSYAAYLRKFGFLVDAFCEPGSRFVFYADELEGGDTLNHITGLAHPLFQKTYQEDKKWLDWCDACVIILPAGRSAHLEGGYAKGCGKLLFIMSHLTPGEWDVMYGMADKVINVESPQELVQELYKYQPRLQPTPKEDK